MKAKEKLQQAMEHALKNRPKIGGFPYLAECLRLAGVERNIWTLPAAQSVYEFRDVVLVNQGTPLTMGLTEIGSFDVASIVKALKTDQAGLSTFPEFLHAIFAAGVVRYEVDFKIREVCYIGTRGEKYNESYDAALVADFPAL